MRLLAPPAVDRAAGAQALLLAAGGLLALGIIARRWGAPGGPVAPAATEVALRAALRHRDNAIAQVAHDLKTPLTVLKGHAQLLQRALVATDGADAARLRAGLAAIDAAATAAADRIDRLAGETGPPGET